MLTHVPRLGLGYLIAHRLIFSSLAESSKDLAITRQFEL